jgi:GNAT superfamily N-acetyltransferase
MSLGYPDESSPPRSRSRTEFEHSANQEKTVTEPPSKRARSEKAISTESSLRAFLVNSSTDSKTGEKLLSLLKRSKNESWHTQSPERQGRAFQKWRLAHEIDLLEKWYDRILRRNMHTKIQLDQAYYFKKDDRVMGRISFRRESSGNIGEIHIFISYVVIHPAYRGQGYCKRLISYFVQQMESKYPQKPVWFSLVNAGGIAACRCYVNAFRLNGYAAYDSFHDESSDSLSLDAEAFALMHIEDCETLMQFPDSDEPIWRNMRFYKMGPDKEEIIFKDGPEGNRLPIEERPASYYFVNKDTVNENANDYEFLYNIARLGRSEEWNSDSIVAGDSWLAETRNTTLSELARWRSIALKKVDAPATIPHSKYVYLVIDKRIVGKIAYDIKDSSDAPENKEVHLSLAIVHQFYVDEDDPCTTMEMYTNLIEKWVVYEQNLHKGLLRFWIPEDHNYISNENYIRAFGNHDYDGYKMEPAITKIVCADYTELVNVGGDPDVSGPLQFRKINDPLH